MWTDERLDQEFSAVRAEIAALRIELREEMHQGFRDIRAEMHEGFRELRSQMHLTMLGMLGTMTSTLVAVVAHAI